MVRSSRQRGQPGGIGDRHRAPRQAGDAVASDPQRVALGGVEALGGDRGSRYARYIVGCDPVARRGRSQVLRLTLRAEESEGRGMLRVEHLRKRQGLRRVGLVREPPCVHGVVACDEASMGSGSSGGAGAVLHVRRLDAARGSRAGRARGPLARPSWQPRARRASASTEAGAPRRALAAITSALAVRASAPSRDEAGSVPLLVAARRRVRVAVPGAGSSSRRGMPPRRRPRRPGRPTTRTPRRAGRPPPCHGSRDAHPARASARRRLSGRRLARSAKTVAPPPTMISEMMTTQAMTLTRFCRAS